MRSLAGAAAAPMVLDSFLFNRGGVEQLKEWRVSDSDALYRVGGWGSPFFFINSKGKLCVRPKGNVGGDGIELTAVVHRVSARMKTPLIVRFPEIVECRLKELQGAFDYAIAQRSYAGTFQGVFPVKCNPDRFLVEDIVRYGRSFHFGLEAGSKPELLLAMASMCKASPDALLICNGYKDAEYVRLALLARQLGINCLLVVEQQEEVELIIELSKETGIRPAIGMRAKLSTRHDGHWGDTSGENGKFGLSALEIVDVVQALKCSSMLDCLQLLHFHVGSQIPVLAIVEESVREAAHIFCDLKLMGASGMKYLDIGGGLGIDYDGSFSSSSDLSVGYTVQQYAVEVVFAVEAACSIKGIAERPVICCESGRGLVSHYSVLVFDVFGTCRRGRAAAASKSASAPSAEDRVKSLCDVLVERLPAEMRESGEQVVAFAREGSYAVALDVARTSLKAEGSRLFKAGMLSLEQRAVIERLCEALGAAVDERLQGSLKFEAKQVATYNVNLSMFKSLPDCWAIGQLFPILPLHRLNEEPTVAAHLSDLTCDSDGRIRDFILSPPGGDAAGGCYCSKRLPVHELVEGEPYYVGAFLVGAYQEALGSNHNLFGGMNVVHVVSSSSSGTGFEVLREVGGQSVASVLTLAQHDPCSMFDALRSKMIASLHSDGFEDECEARAALHSLARCFSSYTYLSSDDPVAADSTTVCTPMVNFCC